MSIHSEEDHKICPQCNGLTNYVFPCPKCGTMMVDGGKVDDYYDNYSPYLPQVSNDIISDTCIHLYYCPHCGYDKRIGIQKKDV